MSGTLYVVATPIGNLQDITLRAIDTLKAMDVIACEDTRQTAKLLSRYEIHKPLVSLHEYNERQRTPQLLEKLKAGESIALVSDGGTPLISDPGWFLVRKVLDEKLPVSWIPGPTALIGALALSGLPTDRFVFEGFLPVKSGARRKRLEALKSEPRTVVLYESPHRLVKTLREIAEVFGDVPASVSRELTKMFEDVNRGTISEIVAHFERRAPRGELVIVFQPANPHTRPHANATS